MSKVDRNYQINQKCGEYLKKYDLLNPIETFHQTSKRINGIKLNQFNSIEPLIDHRIKLYDLIIVEKTQRCYEVKTNGPQEVAYVFPIVREFMNLWDPMRLIHKDAYSIDEYDFSVELISSYLYTTELNEKRLTNLINRYLIRHFHDMIPLLWLSFEQCKTENWAKGIIARIKFNKINIYEHIVRIMEHEDEKGNYYNMSTVTQIMLDLKKELEKNFTISCVKFIAHDGSGSFDNALMFFEYANGGPFIDAFFYNDRMKIMFPNSTETTLEFANPAFSSENIIKLIKSNEYERD